MEHSASPPELSQRDRFLQPWVWEACRTCVTSAMLVLLANLSKFSNSRPNPEFCRNWCEMQLLLACCIVLTLVRHTESVRPLISDLTFFDITLDSIDYALSQKSWMEVGTKTT